MEVYVFNTEFDEKREIFIFEDKLVGLRGKIKDLLFKKFHFESHEDVDEVANQLVRTGSSYGPDRTNSEYEEISEYYTLTKQEVL